MDRFFITPESQAAHLFEWSFAAAPWRIAVLQVTMIDPHRVKTLRRAGLRDRPRFVRQTLNAVRSAFTEDQIDILRSWEDHHTPPLVLGGSNDKRVLAPEWLHDEIHDFLNRQLCGMIPGMTREIFLPEQDGLLWGWDAQPLLPNPRYRRRIRWSRLETAC